jgi:hypothetical protein
MMTGLFTNCPLSTANAIQHRATLVVAVPRDLGRFWTREFACAIYERRRTVLSSPAMEVVKSQNASSKVEEAPN